MFACVCVCVCLYVLMWNPFDGEILMTMVMTMTMIIVNIMDHFLFCFVFFFKFWLRDELFFFFTPSFQREVGELYSDIQ